MNHYRTTNTTGRKPKISWELVLLWIFTVPCLSLNAQHAESDSRQFVVILNEGETDISPTGVNVHTCALVLPDGRFHLERRVQQLPNSSATLKIFESTLDSVQFRELQETLNGESIRKLLQFVWPAAPMIGTRFRGFRARIARGDQTQSTGYFELQGATSGKASDSEPSDIEKGWEQSKTGLRPLLQWFQGLKASKLEPSDKKSTLCSTDSEQ